MEQEVVEFVRTAGWVNYGLSKVKLKNYERARIGGAHTMGNLSVWKVTGETWIETTLRERGRERGRERDREGGREIGIERQRERDRRER